MFTRLFYTRYYLTIAAKDAAAIVMNGRYRYFSTGILIGLFPSFILPVILSFYFPIVLQQKDKSKYVHTTGSMFREYYNIDRVGWRIEMLSVPKAVSSERLGRSAGLMTLSWPPEILNSPGSPQPPQWVYRYSVGYPLEVARGWSYYHSVSRTYYYSDAVQFTIPSLLQTTLSGSAAVLPLGVSVGGIVGNATIWCAMYCFCAFGFVFVRSVVRRLAGECGRCGYPCIGLCPECGASGPDEPACGSPGIRG